MTEKRRLSELLKNRRILFTIISSLIILVGFGIAFLIFKNNFTAFFIATCICIIPIFCFSKNKKTGLLLALYAGFFGFMTEWWGCGLGYWTWRETISIHMMFGIFPIEMPIIYFFCGLWVNQVLNEVYSTEIEDFRENQHLHCSKHGLIFVIITIITTYSIFIISPVWIQSMLILSTGLILMMVIAKRIIILSFGLFMGFIGFLLENFATGGFSSELIIWQYDFLVHETALIVDPIIIAMPISAVIAYLGTGLILCSLIFIGVKTVNKNTI